MGDSEFWDAVTRFANMLLENYGPGGTLAIFVGAIVLSMAWRIYRERKKDKATDELIREKDRTIQRMAERERMWRSLWLLDNTDMTHEMVERLVLENEFESPAEARKHLEGREARRSKKRGHGR